MTLRHLEIFIEVRRMESITKAANNLNLAQPAVSRAIRELESYYGTKLFERMNRKLYVSQAGEQLFLYADSIISQFYEAKDVLSDQDHATQIRIGSNVSCSQKIIPNLLKEFRSTYPDIPIYLKVANSTEIEESLLLNELDFAFMDTPKKSEYFFSQKICEDNMLILCAKNYPINNVSIHPISANHVSENNIFTDHVPEKNYPANNPAKNNFPADQYITFSQLQQHPLLVREPGSGSRQMVDQLFSQNNAQPKIVMESSNVYSLKEMCKAGCGMLILTQCMADSWSDAGSLREIFMQDLHIKRTYCFVYHKSKYLTKSMKHFSRFIAKNGCL